MEVLNEGVQSKEELIESLHSEWFPKLKELTDLLNLNFVKFLNYFGCDGLIELDIGVTRVNIYLLISYSGVFPKFRPFQNQK